VNLVAIVTIAFLAMVIGLLAMILIATWRPVDEE
jgi:hypothetical protein